MASDTPTPAPKPTPEQQERPATGASAIFSAAAPRPTGAAAAAQTPPPGTTPGDGPQAAGAQAAGGQAKPAQPGGPQTPQAAGTAAKPANAAKPAGGAGAGGAQPAQPAAKQAAPQAAPRPAPPTEGRLIPADAATAAAAARAQGAAAAPQQHPAPARPAAAAPAQVAGGAAVPAMRGGGGAPPAHPAAAAFPPVRPPAPMATPRARHKVLMVSFLLLVLLPTALWGLYLWTRATDQFSSTVGFSVRREEGTQPIDLLGGMFGKGGSSGASDTDILYEFIRSPDLVQRADKKLNLRAMFSRDWPHDFVFAFDPDGTIEDLTRYWQRQVKLYYDDGAGIMTVKVSAFSPQDAQAIAQTIFDESERVVNALSDQARSDATKQAEAELEKARGMLTEARQAMTAFRVRTRIVDPTVDLGAQMTVMTALQGQLAEAQVTLDTLRQNARPNDQRVLQAEKRIGSLENQIEQERAKFGGESEEGQNYAQLMADYERLRVDQEFAEGAHQAARIAYEAATANAQRQTRYLAAHIAPTLAERSLEPSRPWLLAMGAGLALILWSIMILIYYSVRDRR